jgi:TonB family protein
MIDLITALEAFGSYALEIIWFPLLIWTALALPAAYLFHRFESIPPIYQYHGRVGLLLALPLGITASLMLDLIPQATPSAATAKFFVVQNPITVSASASASQTSAIFSDPVMWIGILSAILVVGAVYLLLKMMYSFLQLKKLDYSLNFDPLSESVQIVTHLPDGKNQKLNNTYVAFSEEINVPFTFGWLSKKIVIPKSLQNDSELLAMAVQHELVHIQHRDFLLNNLLISIRSLFWMHPLTHYLHNSSREYREITCDSKVLANNHFSKKRYATLLCDLAQQNLNPNLAMSMAVNPSSLKKRIKIMSEQTFSSTTFRSSFVVTFLSASLIVLAIGCSDISDNGITKSEVDQTQAQMYEQPAESQPLYIVNGEQWNDDKNSNKSLSLIKPKYIKSIEVLKDDDATAKYGEAGKNGVVKITLNNPEKALSDLRTVEELKRESQAQNQNEDFFVAVENMPKLKGGKKWLYNEIGYPQQAREAGIEGKVYVQFIVNKQGDVENPQILRGVEPLNEEALRVVKKAKFTPGTQKGQPVRVQFSLPITFELQGDGKSNEEDSANGQASLPPNSMDETVVTGYTVNK